MKREIKFRGKKVQMRGSMDTSEAGEFVFGSYVWDGYEHFIITDENIEWCVDPETVGQAFDFGDREDNKLYPGDIIKTIHTRTIDNGENDPFGMPKAEEYEKIGLLEYHRGYTFGPRLRWKKGHMMIPNTSTLWRMKAVKIGNRWDNPDLLEGGYE
jgi:hypothetical protein